MNHDPLYKAHILRNIADFIEDGGFRQELAREGIADLRDTRAVVRQVRAIAARVERDG